MCDWDWKRSEYEFVRAIEVDPANALAHVHNGLRLLSLGRNDEAIAAGRRALELNPVSPIIPILFGVILLFAGGHDDEAIEQFNNALILESDHVVAHGYLTRAYRYCGLYDLALEEAQKLLSLWQSPFAQFPLAAAHAAMGRREEALEVITNLEGVSARTHEGAFYIATIYICLHDRDNTMRWLEIAYEQHDQFLPWLKVGREFRELLDDPRLQNLVRRIGIPSS